MPQGMWGRLETIERTDDQSQDDWKSPCCLDDKQERR